MPCRSRCGRWTGTPVEGGDAVGEATLVALEDRVPVLGEVDEQVVEQSGDPAGYLQLVQPGIDYFE